MQLSLRMERCHGLRQACRTGKTMRPGIGVQGRRATRTAPNQVRDQAPVRMMGAHACKQSARKRPLFNAPNDCIARERYGIASRRVKSHDRAHQSPALTRPSLACARMQVGPASNPTLPPPNRAQQHFNMAAAASDGAAPSAAVPGNGAAQPAASPAPTAPAGDATHVTAAAAASAPAATPAAAPAAAAAAGPASGLGVLQASEPMDRIRYQALLVFDQFDQNTTDGAYQGCAEWKRQPAQCAPTGPHTHPLPVSPPQATTNHQQQQQVTSSFVHISAGKLTGDELQRFFNYSSRKVCV